jgi:uncharacterized protein (TIGR02757 family)
MGRTLEALYRLYGAESTGSDPVHLAQRYANPRDIEAAAWIASAFAYGRVDAILDHVRRILDLLGPAPAEALALRRFSARDLAFFRHRFHGPEEAALLLHAIGETIRRDGSVGAFFQNRYRGEDSTAELLTRVSAEILSWLPNRSAAVQFLFPSPARGSACKRWNLYLRWMVRRDAIDFGLWDSIPKSALIIPTDTHVHRVARRLGLTRRKSADWKTAREITARLKQIDPADPVKFDFALCQLGTLGICRPELSSSNCFECTAREACPAGRRRLVILQHAGRTGKKGAIGRAEEVRVA